MPLQTNTLTLKLPAGNHSNRSNKHSTRARLGEFLTTPNTASVRHKTYDSFSMNWLKILWDYATRMKAYFETSCTPLQMETNDENSAEISTTHNFSMVATPPTGTFTSQLITDNKLHKFQFSNAWHTYNFSDKQVLNLQIQSECVMLFVCRHMEKWTL